MEKKVDRNYTRMLWAILNRSWRQHDTRELLYNQLPPIAKTIQVRRTRHAVHSKGSRDELISDVLMWTPSHGRTKLGKPARTYIQQFCVDTGYSLRYLLEAIDDRNEWRQRVRETCARSASWWWWWPNKIEHLSQVFILLVDREFNPQCVMDLILNCIWW